MSSRPPVRTTRSRRYVQGGQNPDGPSAMLPKSPRIKWDVIALHAAVISGLLVISIIMWWRVWVTGHPTSTITCLCGDESGTLGTLAWTPWALIHGHNPFFSNAIYAGQGGVNMLTNTSWIAGSLVFSPVTWLFGPIATFNVAVTLAPVASGWCCFLAVRRFSRFVPGQLAAALLYGVSPIIVSREPVGNLAQIWLIYPPLAFLCLYDLFVTQRHRPVPLGVGLGLLTVMQFFVGTEVLAISLLVGGIGVTVAAILAPLGTWARSRRILLGLTTAAGIVVVCLVYPAWFALDGPRHIVGSPIPGTLVGVPISGVISTGPYVHQPIPLSELSGYSGNGGPDISFLGPAMLAYLAISALVWFRERLAWVLVAVGLSSWLFSLGTASTWMPWRLFQNIPLLAQIGPERFSAVTVFAAALLLALSADRWRHVIVRHYGRRHEQLRRSHATRSLGLMGAFLSVATVATLAPVGAAYSFPFVVQDKPVPPWFTHMAPRLLPGTVLLTYPYPSMLDQQATAWQAVDGMRFRIVGGGGFVPGRDGRHSEAVSPFGGTISTLNALSQAGSGLPPLPSATSATVRRVRLSLDDWGVQVVVVPMAKEGRDPAYAAGFFTAVLGRLPRIQAHAWVWYGLGDLPPVSIDRQALFACTSPESASSYVSYCVLQASQHGDFSTP